MRRKPCLNLNELWEDNNTKTVICPNEHRLINLETPQCPDTIRALNLSALEKLGNIAVCFKIFGGSNIEAKDQLVSRLTELGYTFVLLKRHNIEQMLLSQLLAELSQNWFADEYSKSFIDVNVASTIFASRMFTLNQYDEFIERNQQYLYTAPTIYYETIFDDIGKLLNITIPADLTTKQNKNSHYDYIENSEEIRELLFTYISQRCIKDYNYEDNNEYY